MVGGGGAGDCFLCRNGYDDVAGYVGSFGFGSSILDDIGRGMRNFD